MGLIAAALSLAGCMQPGLQVELTREQRIAAESLGSQGGGQTPAVQQNPSIPPTLCEKPLTQLPDSFADTCFDERIREIRLFEPRYPLWSDTASKRRWIFLPSGAKIISMTATPDEWEFPVGTRFWKEFVVDGKKIETRFFYKVTAGKGPTNWLFTTYRWNDAETMATRLDTGEDNVRGTAHRIPASADCLRCHKGGHEWALGFTALQLTPKIVTPPKAVSMIDPSVPLSLGDLIDEGRFTENPTQRGFDIPGTAQQRAMIGYQQGNCAMCHNPTGDCPQANFRHALDDPATTMNRLRPYIVAGLPPSSQLSSRMSSRPGMPPIASKIVDIIGVRKAHDLIFSEAGPMPEFPVDVAMNSYNGCVLSNLGNVKCWTQASSNVYPIGTGSAGVAAELTTASPKLQLSTASGVVASKLAAGGYATCAVLSNGSVRCWGGGMVVVGPGVTWTPTALVHTQTPAANGDVPLGMGVTAVDVAVSDFHACAILSNGAVRCWGRGDEGQLGYGNATTVTVPADAGDVPVGRPVKQLALGLYSTCALLDDGSVKCWGDSRALGYGGVTAGGVNLTGMNLGRTPTSVPSMLPALDLGEKAVQIAASVHTVCALLVSGQIRCWGVAGNSDLGAGYGVDVGVTNPIRMTTVNPVGFGKKTDGSIIPALSVFKGDGYICATSFDGQLSCWGGANNPMISGLTTTNIDAGSVVGYGAASVVSSSTHVNWPPTALPLGTGIYAWKWSTARFAGVSCAILTGGRLRCWGARGGALGYLPPSGFDSSKASTAPDLNPFGGVNFVQPMAPPK